MRKAKSVLYRVTTSVISFDNSQSPLFEDIFNYLPLKQKKNFYNEKNKNVPVNFKRFKEQKEKKETRGKRVKLCKKKITPFLLFLFKINVIDQFHYLTGISKFSDLIRASNRIIRTSEHEINSKLD